MYAEGLKNYENLTQGIWSPNPVLPSKSMKVLTA
jgi:hypothetical protein